MSSSKSGSHHWIMQRITAVILVFSIFWLFKISGNISGASMNQVVLELQKPCNIIALIIFALAGFYHGALGMQVIIEDYVSRPCLRNALIILVNIFSFITIVASLAALVYLMVL